MFAFRKLLACSLSRLKGFLVLLGLGKKVASELKRCVTQSVKLA